MVSNAEIAEKLDELMFHYRRSRDPEKAAAFSLASTKLRKMDEPVAGMSADSLREFKSFREPAIRKIREYVETGELSGSED